MANVQLNETEMKLAMQIYRIKNHAAQLFGRDLPNDQCFINLREIQSNIEPCVLGKINNYLDPLLNEYATHAVLIREGVETRVYGS